MRKNGMKRQNGRRRAAALWLAGVMAFSLAGCGGKGGDDGIGGTATKTDELSGDAVAMGRYVETMLDVDTGELMDLKELSDGKLVLLENGAEGRWVSEDKGVTWKPDALPGWNDLAMNYYVYDMKAAPDGSVAMLCRSFAGLTEAVEEDAGEPGDGEEAEKVKKRRTARNPGTAKGRQTKRKPKQMKKRKRTREA